MKNLLKKLIRAESTAEKGELAAAKIILEELEKSEIICDIDSWQGCRANITAHVKSEGGKAALLFASHLDVVGANPSQWKYPPFSGFEEDGKIFGRGSADMKGGIVAVVTAIKDIVDSGIQLKGDLIFFGAAGEESDSCGAKRFVGKYAEKLSHSANVIVTEPTDFEVVTGHRGMLWVKLVTNGKTAHGSTPHLGINAIASMVKMIAELEDHKNRKLPNGCSMSINKIVGGETINIIADKCEIGIDIRTLGEQDHRELISDLEKIVAKLKQQDGQFDAEISVLRDMNSLSTDKDCGFVRDFCSAIGSSETKSSGFATDGPFFASLGLPVIIFGPGKADFCHKANEYIELADLEKAVEYYKKIILKFLS